MTRKFGYRIPTHSFHRWVTSVQNMNVLNCTYNTSLSLITMNTGQTECAFSISNVLADIPNVAEFTVLFDQYKLTGIKYQIKMVPNPDANYKPGSTTTLNPVNYFPTIWYCADFDDNNTQTIAQIKEFERVKHKVLRPNQELNIFVRPKTLTQQFRTATTTGYAVDFKPHWLDMAQTDIPYYGLKAVVDMEGFSSSTDTMYLKINAKYYFKCKGTR